MNLMYGETTSLLKYFQEQINKNSAFHYAVQLDNEEKIITFFGADARMIADYVYFGDMMTFDTTFITNK
jgi:zinc finger SWIM domain-containing protein 3